MGLTQLVGALSCNQKFAGLIPGSGTYRRQPIDVALSHQCFSLHSSFATCNEKMSSSEDFSKAKQKKRNMNTLTTAFSKDCQVPSLYCQLKVKSQPVADRCPNLRKKKFWKLISWYLSTKELPYLEMKLTINMSIILSKLIRSGKSEYEGGGVPNPWIHRKIFLK